MGGWLYIPPAACIGRANGGGGVLYKWRVKKFFPPKMRVDSLLKILVCQLVAYAEHVTLYLLTDLRRPFHFFRGLFAPFFAPSGVGLVGIISFSWGVRDLYADGFHFRVDG